MNELSGKVALVTGAAKNIGRSIALSLAAEGAAVGVNTRASRSEADQVASEIRSAGGTAEVFMADVADPAAVQAMVEGIIKKFGRLDILVLNAAHRNEVSFMDMDFEEWRRVMSITLDSTFLCIKAALPHLVKAGGGDIITFGGARALSSAANRVHVAAAKHGVVGLTRTLAKEVAQYGVRVNCVSPGPIATSRAAGRANHKTPINGIPLGRLGEPDEIAAMVRFLCGPGGKFITGQTMHVNGGTQMSS